MQAVSNSNESARVQKQFKKVLKRMGPLRDVQVQLENLARLRVNGVITDFKETLKRREKNTIKDIRRDLKRGERRRLEEGSEDLRCYFEGLRKATADSNVRR